MTDKEKIDVLIENYKIVSGESKSYLTEMIRCFLYSAVVLAIAFGYGDHIEGLIKYMPLALLGLVTYFFSLGFMYINASRYKAQIEKKINVVASDDLFGFESIYKPDLLKTGMLPISTKKKNYRILPVPNFFLVVALIVVFLYLIWYTKQFWLYIILSFVFALVALYVFLLIPRIIERYQKAKNWI
ncbi:hypothetical protein [Pinibacter aurantiacus]|uniref:Uncharacterized protein n=1 Tax=Pinibacter aurantiacus TaxID=2851599 RepID=A0A9E2W719_9BACT|nr:hypothetical protein [Pinibacter aurantiacus]MBV4360498.1 hypothetical protein [Pinibacter aurantiacus]